MIKIIQQDIGRIFLAINSLIIADATYFEIINVEISIFPVYIS